MSPQSFALTLCATLSIWAAGAYAAQQELCVFPQAANAQSIKFKPSDNGSDVKAFKCQVKPDAIEINFTDRPKEDNYLFVDLGNVDITTFWPGGYVAVDMEIDNPIVRSTIALAQADNFWPTKTTLEGEAMLRPGRHEYHFYLDNLLESRAKSSGKDRFMLFLHDTGKPISESAKILVHKISLQPQSKDWKQEKDAQYSTQYDHTKLRDWGQLYRGVYDRLVAWDSLQDSPFCNITSLDGTWSKRYLGDLTWNYEGLQDLKWTAPTFDDSAWESVNVPEPQVEEQKGGHYAYRKKFKIDSRDGKKIYLRLDDVADYAEIYINGVRASNQTSCRRRHDWIVEGGSRHAGKNVKEMLIWNNFDRCKIPCPFDKDSIPENEKSLMLPIYTGENIWPMATDISDLLVNGENTIAIRLYGCPVKGFWIFREMPEDRPFHNIFGILEHVKMLCDATPAIASINKDLPEMPDESGLAIHKFTCAIDPRFATEVARVELNSAGLPTMAMEQTQNGVWTASVKIPTGFGKRSMKATALDKAGKAIDERAISFPEMVFKIIDRKMYVNGDLYFARGINAAPGIEWDNNRTATRTKALQTPWIQHPQDRRGIPA